MRKPLSRLIKSEAGFTIFEVLVAALVVAMLAAIATPSLSQSVNAHRLSAGIRKSVGAIRTARSAAISRNVQARVTVTNDGKTLSVEANRPGVGWTVVGVPVVLEGGVSVTTVTPTNGLLFSGQGTVVSNGTVTVTLQNAPGATRQIQVSLLGGVDLV